MGNFGNLIAVHQRKNSNFIRDNLSQISGETRLIGNGEFHVFRRNGFQILWKRKKLPNLSNVAEIICSDFKV